MRGEIANGKIALEVEMALQNHKERSQDNLLITPSGSPLASFLLLWLLFAGVPHVISPFSRALDIFLLGRGSPLPEDSVEQGEGQPFPRP